MKTKDKELKKPPKYFYLLMIIIPILFFVLLEFGLRIFNYGYVVEQWDTATEGKLMLNQEIARRYFYNIERIPLSNQDVFDEVKKQNAYRIFVLGESSAAGYPFSPLGSFSRYIRDRLEVVYPNSVIEVVNLSLTAVNSYTLRDLFPGVLEQKPDLILIYTGHNEYYGALGVGSMESLGTSRTMINLLLYLNEYRTVQLVRNTLQWVMGLFSSTDDKATGTMMSRMAKDQYIGFNTETFNAGISQFEDNMRDILDMAKEKNVPIILSTLASNLKDQRPFISVDSEKYPRADKIFNQAKAEMKIGNIKIADSLFRFAKDLDALRFRASEKLNQSITLLSKEYKLPLVDFDSALSSMSTDGIIGNDIMTDHLHPTLEGQFILGKIFFEKMEQSKNLPRDKAIDLSAEKQDSITIANFNFTEFDSVISDFRIKILKNDWPFVNKKDKKPNSRVLNLKNFEDSLAAEVLDDKITWEEGHRKLAAYYLVKRNLESFIEEMDALISQYPVIIEYYDYVAKVLIERNDYGRAYKYLNSGYNVKPNAFKTKWLGTIALYNDELETAEKYLNESLNHDKNDSQVWYNLAGIYVKRNDYKKALELVGTALSLKSNYPEALKLQKQLQGAVK
jgi:tetratricopeptide (TPR) repeat protein